MQKMREKKQWRLGPGMVLLFVEAGYVWGIFSLLLEVWVLIELQFLFKIKGGEGESNS